MCQRVLEWARDALTRLQAAYSEIDVLKEQRRQQEVERGQLETSLMEVRGALDIERAGRAAEVAACHRMIEDLQEQLAEEKARTRSLGGDLAAERRLTVGLQTALSTTRLSTAILARAAGISEGEQRRVVESPQQLARE